MRFRKTNLGIRINNHTSYVCQVSGETNNFEFFVSNLSKNEIKVGNSENKSWNKNQQLWDILCAIFQAKRTNLNSSTQILPKNEFWGQNSKNLSLDLESAPPRYHVSQYSSKTESFDSFSPNLPQNWFLGSEFQKSKSGSGISVTEIPVCQFPIKINNSEFFGLNLGKLPHYMQYFDSNSVESVVESWVDD